MITDFQKAKAKAKAKASKRGLGHTPPNNNYFGL